MTEDLNPDAPFVPRGIPVDTRRRPIPAELEECKRLAREGAAAVHARAAGADNRRPPLTDAESAAIARAKIDRSQQ